MPTNWNERKALSSRLPSIEDPKFAEKMQDLADEISGTIRVLNMIRVCLPMAAALPEAGQLNHLAGEMCDSEPREAFERLVEYLRHWSDEEAGEIVLTARDMY